MRSTHTLFTALSVLFFSLGSQAYNTTMSNGQIVQPGAFDVVTQGQYLTQTQNSGLNLNTKLETGLTEDSNLIAEFGAGHIDFHGGAYWKWVPFPDFENQPAIGFIAGGYYGKIDSENEFALKISPLISKTFHLNAGQITPYMSTPIGLRFIDSSVDTPVQLQIGTEISVEGLKDISFLTEVGINLIDSPTYFSFGVGFSL